MGKVVLVTGGNIGIGAEITKAFAEKGYSIIMHYFEEPGLAEKLCSMIKTKCLLVKGDITTRQTHDAILDAVKKIGGIDVLVNNAGINPQKDIFSATEKDWLDTFRVNVVAPFQLTQLLAPLLKKSKGAIVNITSIRAESPRAGNITYGPSKAALVNFTKAAATALAPDVRVNCISPGPTATRMQKGKEERKKESVFCRMAEPHEIAHMVVHVAENTFMTGSNVVVDGGALL